MDVMVSIPRTSCIEPSHEKTCFCHMQLCCSLCRQYNTSTCYIQNFKPLACFIVKCMNFNAKQELHVGSILFGCVPGTLTLLHQKWNKFLQKYFERITQSTIADCCLWLKAWCWKIQMVLSSDAKWISFMHDSPGHRHVLYEFHTLEPVYIKITLNCHKIYCRAKKILYPPKMYWTDAHIDLQMPYFEAFFWCKDTCKKRTAVP